MPTIWDSIQGGLNAPYIGPATVLGAPGKAARYAFDWTTGPPPFPVQSPAMPAMPYGPEQTGAEELSRAIANAMQAAQAGQRLDQSVGTPDFWSALQAQRQSLGLPSPQARSGPGTGDPNLDWELMASQDYRRALQAGIPSEQSLSPLQLALGNLTGGGAINQEQPSIERLLQNARIDPTGKQVGIGENRGTRMAQPDVSAQPARTTVGDDRQPYSVGGQQIAFDAQGRPHYVDNAPRQQAQMSPELAALWADRGVGPGRAPGEMPTRGRTLSQAKTQPGDIDPTAVAKNKSDREAELKSRDAKRTENAAGRAQARTDRLDARKRSPLDNYLALIAAQGDAQAQANAALPAKGGAADQPVAAGAGGETPETALQWAQVHQGLYEKFRADGHTHEQAMAAADDYINRFRTPQGGNPVAAGAAPSGAPLLPATPGTVRSDNIGDLFNAAMFANPHTRNFRWLWDKLATPDLFK